MALANVTDLPIPLLLRSTQRGQGGVTLCRHGFEICLECESVPHLPLVRLLPHIRIVPQPCHFLFIGLFELFLCGAFLTAGFGDSLRSRLGLGLGQPRFEGDDLCLASSTSSFIPLLLRQGGSGDFLHTIPFLFVGKIAAFVSNIVVVCVAHLPMMRKVLNCAPQPFTLGFKGSDERRARGVIICDLLSITANHRESAFDHQLNFRHFITSSNISAILSISGVPS
jgi:hypothetical protein